MLIPIAVDDMAKLSTLDHRYEMGSLLCAGGYTLHVNVTVWPTLTSNFAGETVTSNSVSGVGCMMQKKKVILTASFAKFIRAS